MITTKEERRPLHEKVREHLRTEYLNGSCEALPSLRDLSQKLEINHATITRALRDLEQEGIVKIIPRKGIFPTDKATAQPRIVSKPALNAEMVVLYDDVHEQLEVARPIYEGMQQACAIAKTNDANGTTNGHNGSSANHEAMKVTRSMWHIAPVPEPESFVQQARVRGTSGIVFLGFGYLDFPESLVESRFIFEVSQELPVVLAGTPHAQLPLDSVYCDPRPQIREFLEDHYANGLRRYEFFGSGSLQPHQVERQEEFCNFLMKHGLTWNREFLGGDSSEELAARLREIPELPEVVVATNINRAIIVALEAQRRGLSLPDDLKLLCFASLPQHAQPLLPYASVLLFDEQEVGVQAWQLLQDRFNSASVTSSDKNGSSVTPIIKRIPARFISRY